MSQQQHIGRVFVFIPSVSAASMTPSLYLRAITEVPVTMGDLRGEGMHSADGGWVRDTSSALFELCPSSPHVVC